MSRKSLAPALQRWIAAQAYKLLGDGELLERFRRWGDEEAFAALLERHGPMVRGVCTRILRDVHEVEDACQATFLIFVRQAATIRKGEAVASWLHGVARRAALTALRQNKALPAQPAASDAAAPHGVAAEQAELRGCLDEEIGRLPVKYRAPITLCYLEGRTVDQAATDLAWPRGSVAGRLARAKEILRRRLTRRGFAVAGLAAMETKLAADAASPLPNELARQILQNGAQNPLGTIPASVSSLAAGTQHMLWHGKSVGMLLFGGVLAILGCVTLAAFARWSGSAGHVSPATLSLPADKPGSVEWHLHLAAGERRFALNPDSRDRHDLGEMPLGGELSPDGRHWACLKRNPNAPGGWEVVLTAVDAKTLPAVNLQHPLLLCWSPDGKKVAYTGQGGRARQIYEMEIATGQVRQVTKESTGAHSPGYHPGVTLVYVVDRERSGKVLLGDLIMQGPPQRILAKHDYITGYDFSPDGKQIAYCTTNGLAVQDLASGEERLFKVKEVNPAWGVTFAQPYWRPDGKALAVGFVFLGGVMVGPDGNVPVIPGTDQAAILPLDGGRIEHFPIGSGTRLLGWCDARGNPPPRRQAALPQLTPKTWWLVVHAGSTAYAVRDDGGQVRKVPTFSIGQGPETAKASDGTRQAVVEVEGNICQIYERMEADGTRRRVSTPNRHAVKPRYHTDGNLAFLEELDGEPAFPPQVNLMFSRDGQTWAFVKDKPILEYAFSPNGRYLAYACPTEFVVHDLHTGVAKSCTRESLDPAWTASFHRLLWRPDSQAVAVQLINLDRLRHRNTPVVGENHVVLWTMGDKPQAVKLDRADTLGLWIDEADLEKWQAERSGPGK